jgi:hypothetical protein
MFQGSDSRRQVVSILKKFIDSVKGLDSDEMKEGLIYYRVYFREETLKIDEIESWQSYPEMGFDIVEIRRKDGSTLILFDDKNDLLAILNAILPADDW